MSDQTIQETPENPGAITHKRRLHPELEKRIWKKGQSGNPSGRPKKILTDEYTRLMHQKKLRKKVAQALVQGAIAGKIEHIRELTDRVDGPIDRSAGQARAAIQVQAICVPESWAAVHSNIPPALPEKKEGEE